MSDQNLKLIEIRLPQDNETTLESMSSLMLSIMDQAGLRVFVHTIRKKERRFFDFMNT